MRLPSIWLSSVPCHRGHFGSGRIVLARGGCAHWKSIRRMGEIGKRRLRVRHRLVVACPLAVRGVRVRRLVYVTSGQFG